MRRECHPVEPLGTLPDHAHHRDTPALLQNLSTKIARWTATVAFFEPPRALMR